MRKPFILLASLALCFAFAGCEKDWAPVKLEYNYTTAFAQTTLNNRISGGSGEYSAEISDPEIAEVRVEPSYGAGILLVIETKAEEGEAVITVTDDKSGRSVEFSLTVIKNTTSFKVGEIRVNVDADLPEAVGADLDENALLSEGGSIALTWNMKGSVHDWAFTEADGTETARGTFTLEEDAAEFPPAFGFLPIAGQIRDSKKLFFHRDDGSEWEYDVFIIGGPFTRLDMPPLEVSHTRFYEDLTEYCRTKFPDAGVRSAARALIADY